MPAAFLGKVDKWMGGAALRSNGAAAPAAPASTAASAEAVRLDARCGLRFDEAADTSAAACAAMAEMARWLSALLRSLAPAADAVAPPDGGGGGAARVANDR